MVLPGPQTQQEGYGWTHPHESFTKGEISWHRSGSINPSTPLSATSKQGISPSPGRETVAPAFAITSPSPQTLQKLVSAVGAAVSPGDSVCGILVGETKGILLGAGEIDGGCGRLDMHPQEVFTMPGRQPHSVRGISPPRPASSNVLHEASGCPG